MNISLDQKKKLIYYLIFHGQMSHTHLVKTMRRKEYNHNLPIFQTCQGEVAQKSWAILL